MDDTPAAIAELRGDAAQLRARLRALAGTATRPLLELVLAITEQAEDLARRHSPTDRGGCTWCRDTWVCTEIYRAQRSTQALLALLDSTDPA